MPRGTLDKAWLERVEGAESPQTYVHRYWLGVRRENEEKGVGRKKRGDGWNAETHCKEGQNGSGLMEDAVEHAIVQLGLFHADSQIQSFQLHFKD